LNKIDMVEAVRIRALAETLARAGLAVYPISALTGQGIETLLEELYGMVAQAREQSVQEGALVV
jgi:50S ribosomal subunit-associated GTPase HflX